MAKSGAEAPKCLLSARLDGVAAKFRASASVGACCAVAGNYTQRNFVVVPVNHSVLYARVCLLASPLAPLKPCISPERSVPSRGFLSSLARFAGSLLRAGRDQGNQEAPVAVEGIRPTSGSTTGERGMTFYIAFWLLCAVLAANIVVFLIAVRNTVREERLQMLHRANYARR